ncbi:hypothetical protein [Curvibacter gracilis]|nr:hypothetical protein [Curvibacter gracilis]
MTCSSTTNKTDDEIWEELLNSEESKEFLEKLAKEAEETYLKYIKQEKHP